MVDPSFLATRTIGLAHGPDEDVITLCSSMSSTSESTFPCKANGTRRSGCLRGGLSSVSILCVVIEVLPSSELFSAKTSENSKTNEWSSSHSVTRKSAASRSRAVLAPLPVHCNPSLSRWRLPSGCLVGCRRCVP